MNYYRDLFTALEGAGISYLIVGGVAVNLYGYLRFTSDIDILISLDLENLVKLDQLMKSLGYIERLPVKILDLADEKKLTSYIEEKGLKAYTYIGGQGFRLDLDIIIEESLNFQSFFCNATMIRSWDLSLPVISIDDLMKMKVVANRDKDLLDLEALIQIKNENN
ncbi:hypothetical protein KA036_02145 [Candidatus Gracilibacteria bacterium]|jgi:predicted nucleotidyltransferase|nr:hypothetical protein [Candidatus Gracilibacteria bacterium]